MVGQFVGGPSGSLEAVNTGLGLARTIAKAITHGRVQRQMDADRQVEAAAQRALLNDPPPLHGSAKWATAADLTASGHLRPPSDFDLPSSILLGAFDDDPGASPTGWLHWDGEGHLMTVAPTRSGKSTTQIIPNLLRYRGSCIVLDPKGELYEATSAWRAANVGPVHRIAPFEERTDAFNPLSTIRSAAGARALADLLIPEDPHAQEYFRKDAISFLNGAIQHVCDRAPAHEMTMESVRTITALPTRDFLAAAEIMSRSPIMAVANAGNIVLGKSRERGIPGLRDTLNSELSIWDDEGVRRATRRADVDFHGLKDRPGTVYITVPFDKMAAFAPFLRVVLATALEAMIQNPVKPAIPVLFVLDEFLSLGPFTQFRNAIQTHAGSGVRLWFFLQNIAVLEEHYPTTWRSFFDSAVRMFFGTSDPFTATTISEMLGDTTVAQQYNSYSLGTSVSREDIFASGSGTSLNITRNVALTGRRLATPSEVVQLLSGSRSDGSRLGVLSLNGTPPVLAQLVPYFLGQRVPPRIGRHHG